MRPTPALLIGLLLPLASLQADAADAQVRIELSANVGVARADVSLGDIASVRSTDFQAIKRLVALPLGPAPRTGESTQLSRAELLRWIQLRTGLDPRQIQWEGVGVTHLHRDSSEIQGAQLTEVATERLRGWLDGHSTRAEVVETAAQRDIAVPLGQRTLRARPIPAEAPLARRMVVWVDVWVEDQFVRTVPVGFEVTAYGQAYVAAGDMPAGARFDPLALKVREVELTGRPAPPLAPPFAPRVAAADPGDARQMRRPVAAGQVLTRLDVESQPAVTRGDWVALSVRSGSIEMESRVEALQNGRVGQTVNVKTSKSSAPILARVVAPGQVEITQ